MGSSRIRQHYNNRYSGFKLSNTNPICLKGYPADRYEAAVYWGKGSGRALEIGFGTGSVLFSLKDQYDEYIATELSETMIKQFQKLFETDPRVKIIPNDIEKKDLNFPRGYFDTIIMIAVIEHLVEPVSVLQYCHRLLKPGGKLLINTPNIAKWTRRLKLFFGFFPSTGSSAEGLVTYSGEPADLHDEGHLHYFTFRSLKNILTERIRFSQVEYHGHGKTFLPRLLPSLFSECFLVAIK